MIQRKLSFVLTLLVLSCSALGCGQKLKIRAVRLGQATNLPNAKTTDAQAQAAVERLLNAKIDFNRNYQNVANEIGEDVPLAGQMTSNDQRDLAELQNSQLPLDDLQAKAGRVRGELETLEKAIPQIRIALDANKHDPVKRDAALQQLSNLASVQVPEIKSKLALGEATIKAAMFGGFTSNSVYIINPGSKEWEKAQQYEKSKQGNVVFSSVEAVAANDSVLMVVQESPGQFEPRYVEADPEQAISNSLIAINWVLRAASKIVPLVSLDLAPKSTASPPAAANAPSASVVSADQAEAKVNEVTKTIESLSNDPEVKKLLEKAKTETLTQDEKRTFIAKARTLLAAVNIDHPPSR